MIWRRAARWLASLPSSRFLRPVATAPTILWFRQDLRLADNPALRAAQERGGPIIPVYLWDEASEGRWAPGGASRWWLHHSLAALGAELSRHGSRLVIRRGDTAAELGKLVEENEAGAVYWNRRYEPQASQRDHKLASLLRERGREAREFNSALLFEPETVQNRQGRPFQVFTPFWRHCLSLTIDPPAGKAPKTMVSPKVWPRSLALEMLELLPRIRWDGGLAATWTPGEKGATKRLERFLSSVGNYAEQRDRPADDGSSQLSPFLHFGEIGPRQVWAAIRGLSQSSGVFPLNAGAHKFLAELGWREFSYHLLHHFPQTTDSPLREEFSRFPWARDPGGKLFRRWSRGQTGYPIVDAAMRELWKTGWMPNRLRMITASFLVKHLRLPWQKGAAWFWDTLVDADLPNNTLGWQWVAGCGADAAPFFRIFAPVLQARKFDSEGRYVRRWLPELSQLPDNYLHAPWEAPAEVLRQAGVKLGIDYPRPVVDHREARDAALAAYRSARK